jgi:rod shape determining protein RodA
MRTSFLKDFDLILFVSCLLLILIGILFIYSSGISSTGFVFSNEYIKQMVWAGTGLIIMFVLFFIDYNRFESFSLYIYLFCMLLLLLTLFFGKVVNGSRSWLGPAGIGIQPSEFAKIGFILFYASILKNSGKQSGTLVEFALGLGIVLLPTLLVALQPDLGTAIVYFPIFLVMNFVAGTRKRYIFFMIISVVLLILFVVLPIWEEYIRGGGNQVFMILTKQVFLRYSLLALAAISGLAILGYVLMQKGYFYWIFYSSIVVFISLLGSMGAGLILREYQLMRLIVFLKPGIDPQGAGWNIIQSITAVGSGGIIGKGYLKGTQSHYRFLPQQSTDFIFSIIAEEWGFLGNLLIFALYLIIMIRCIYIIINIKDRFAVYTGAGIMTMFFFHFIVNIGMAMGIMPITGIPLVFLSYGGSSLWTAMIGIGILMNINRQMNQF